MKRKINYTRGEELWNSWSHAAGILLAMVVGTLFIIWAARHENGWATFGVSLYLFGMLGSYVASTVYHAIPPSSPLPTGRLGSSEQPPMWQRPHKGERIPHSRRRAGSGVGLSPLPTGEGQGVGLKERLRRWDHAAIYWHIAGSYSPITLVAMRDQGLWGWALFAFVWTAAIAGTIVSFHKLKPHSNLETICFCLMGLSVLVAFKPLLHCVSTAAVVWIIAEGVCYITGALFYSLHRRRYMHTVFHFFVLAGSVCHIIAVWDILMQYL